MDLKLNRASLSEQVADMLEQEIIEKYPLGARLPSEQALAERYEVSRTIIREAMRTLKERGLIDSKTGSGAYITRPEAQNLSDTVARIIKLNKIDIQSIYDVREILECGAVRRAAAYVTDEELKAMDDTLIDLKDLSLSVDIRRDLDFEFHYLIAKASRNPLLVLLVETMSNVFKEIIASGIFLSGGIDDAIIRHQVILDALRARDVQAADDAMRAHLHQSLDNAEQYELVKRAGIGPHEIRPLETDAREKRRTNL